MADLSEDFYWSVADLTHFHDKYIVISSSANYLVQKEKNTLWPELHQIKINAIWDVKIDIYLYYYKSTKFCVPQNLANLAFRKKNVYMREISYWDNMRYWKTSFGPNSLNFGDENFWYVPPDTSG